MSVLRIGTRGSALALAQAATVADRLEGAQLIPVVTSGDARPDAGDKGRWVGALERALLNGEIDVAIHSAKDVPGELADGCELVAAPTRASALDVLVGAAALDDLPHGARVGTSALRRRAQLLAVRPDLDVIELRGNVDTRLAKLDAGAADALVLARARWQIELLFKLWKSHLRVDEWRSANPWRILTEVYAKLLAALVQHWLMLAGCWHQPDRSLGKAAQAIQAHAPHLAAAFEAYPQLCHALQTVARCLAAAGRLNKRRAAPSTTQLLLALDAEPLA